MSTGNDGQVDHASGTRLRLAGGAVRVNLAAQKDGEPEKPARFDMVAYNGGAMEFYWSDVPVVVDLESLEISDKPRPTLKDHNTSLIVGHTTTIENDGSQLRIAGIFSGAGAVAREVESSARKGFPWQASIGATFSKSRVEEIPRDDEVEVNGQAQRGPLLIVRGAQLMEISFVALGADDTTSASIAAKYGDTTMDPKSNANDGANPDDTATSAQPDTKNSGENVVQAAAAPATQSIEAYRRQMAAEAERVGAVQAVAAKHPKIQAQAISDGWSAEKAELAVLRAEREQDTSGVPAIHCGATPDLSTQMLQAGLMLACRLPDKRIAEAGIDDKTLDAADKRWRRTLSPGQIIAEAARLNGWRGATIKADLRGALQAAFGFSTLDISGILSNTANKFLADAFMSVEQAWRRIAAISPVSDFKQTTRYRLTGADQWQTLANGDQLKHGSLGELSYNNQASTHGLLLSISRQDLINDDLGALNDVPRMIGRGAGQKLNDVFWTKFAADSTIFDTSDGNNNYISGAATALGINGLTTAEQKFMDQTTPNGKPLGVMPSVLLVPTALSATAAQLMRSTEIRNTTASTKYGTANPHQGKFEPVVSAYLGNSSYSNSDLEWYLIADPMDLALIEVVFLNGQEMPTIETADADFSTLGIDMRGYYDFGVEWQEYRAGVKSKGAA